MRKEHERLYAALGWPTGPTLEAVTKTSTAADAPPADETTLALLEERLDENPEAVLEAARQAWDGTLTEAELRTALGAAKAMLASPNTAAASIESLNAHIEAITMPPEFTFDGYDPDSIPINPESKQFQTKADAPRWVLMTASAIAGVLLKPKAQFRWHHFPDRPHVYRRPAPTDTSPIELAFVSDFGTGLPHSRYIAKHLATRKRPYDAVFHLGDVYYAGRSFEFDEHFIGPLAPVAARSPLFTQNGNHEMYSKGYPYFAYMDARRTSEPARHPQEGSYFAVRYGDAFQIVGIDTDYFGHARFRQSDLRSWLARVLSEGRAAGCVNILLPANEPYTHGSAGSTSLCEDLRPFLPMVDAWFWGNTHYCALFDRGGDLPVGSCVGHGGYPYLLGEYDLDREASKVTPAPAPTRWAERGARYPAWTGIRQETGNNGWCDLALHHDRTIALTYWDWMKRERCLARLAPNANGQLVIADCQPF